MSALKAQLKRAREAIASKDWTHAQAAAKSALEIDSQSYNAYVFLGLAQLNLSSISESEAAYRSAIEIDDLQPLAWQGLAGVYEKNNNLDGLIDVLEHQAQIWNTKADAGKLGETVWKLISLKGKSRKQSIDSLSLVLVDSPYYELLSTLPEPDPTNPTGSPLHGLQTLLANTLPTLLQVISFCQAEQTDLISREINKRRTRLTSVPKTAGQTKAEVIGEYYPSSKLPVLWQQALNHPAADDETRRQVEAELLNFYLAWLEALPCPFPDEIATTSTTATHLVNQNEPDEPASTTTQKKQAAKDDVRTKIEGLARGQVILKINSQTAWDVVLDWGEILGPSQSEDPYGYLKSLQDAMPNASLSGLVLAYQQLHAGSTAEKGPSIDDPLEQIQSGFEGAQTHSMLSHVLAGSVYLELKEWLTVIEIAEQGMIKLTRLERMIGKRLPRTRRRLMTYLAIALTHHNPPAHHLRASPYLDAVLCDEPDNGIVLVAKACVLEHAEQWQAAVDLFTRSLDASPQQEPTEKLQVQSKRAWCLLKLGEVNSAISSFQEIIHELEGLLEQDPEIEQIGECLAENWYRLGRCRWQLSHPDTHDGQCLGTVDREEAKQAAYACFIKSIKCDTLHAPSFTYLGLYYADQNDYARSSKCFQKAFELDATQDIAAFKLASEFADEREWDLVEVVAQRLISGGTMAKSGTKESSDENVSAAQLASYQQHAWAWKALGAVELSKGKFAAALTTFQRAIRSSPLDWHIWMKLGLAYKGAGKYVAALKTFIKARQLIDDQREADPSSLSQQSSAWYVNFCVADTQRQIGLFEPAMQLFEQIVSEQPEQVGVQIILAETRYAMALKHSQKGEFAEAERDLIGCLDIARQVVERGGSRIGTKAGWKIAGDVFAELARWNRSIPIETFNVEGEPEDPNQKLKAHQSTFLNLAAKMNVDNVLEQVSCVSCLEVSAIGAENGSAGLFLLMSVVGLKVRATLELSEPGSTNVAQAWADLAISLGNLSRWLESTSRTSGSADQSTFFSTRAGPRSTLAEAVRCIKAALHLEPASSGFWNTLGVLSFNLSPRLSQHALIKSVELGPKNHIGWTNLGFFYLAHSDLELANLAFLKSQTAEPEWSLAWLGQGLIAGLNRDGDHATELVEHAYSLSLGSISSIESCYATMALKIYTHQSHSTQEVSTLVAPLLATIKLLQRHPQDPTVLNLHALVSECSGQLEEAAGSLERSAEILEAVYEVTEAVEVEHRFMVANLNLGRIKLRTGEFEEAIAAMETVLSLRARFNKDDDPPESAWRTTVIRTQAASGIALGRYFINDVEGCLDGLRGGLEELKAVQEDKSLGLEKMLMVHVSALTGLIARVLWVQKTEAGQREARELLVDAICANTAVNVVEFEVLCSLVAMSVVEEADEVLGGILDELEMSIEAGETQPGNARGVDRSKPVGSVWEPRRQLWRRVRELVEDETGTGTRNAKREANTLIHLFELCSQADSSSPDSQTADREHRRVVKRAMEGFLRQVQETQKEMKACYEREMVKASHDALMESQLVNGGAGGVGGGGGSGGQVQSKDISWVGLCLPEQIKSKEVIGCTERKVQEDISS